MDKFHSFFYGETEYPLQHLRPFFCEFVQIAQKEGQTDQRYRCLIEFSNHCFTKGINLRKGEQLSDFPVGLQVDNGKEKRIFCENRYRLSLRLPAILQKMDKTACFFTSADDKFLKISLEEDGGVRVDYEIYFSLQKAKRANCDVHIYINSAYARDSDYYDVPQQARPSRKKISLFVLLKNTMEGKRIKKPK